MRSKLHTVLASAALVAAAALATNSAMADTTLRVPFSFTVAGKTCPPGRYSVKEDHSEAFVILTSEDSSRAFTWILKPGEADYKADKVVLNFDVAGPNHMLRSVQVGSKTTRILDENVPNSEYRSAERAAHPGQ
jgi:hypothetical protein